MHFFLRQTGVIGLRKKKQPYTPKVVRMVTKTAAMFTYVGGRPYLKFTGGLPDPLPPERHEQLRINETNKLMFLVRNGNNIVKLI